MIRKNCAQDEVRKYAIRFLWCVGIILTLILFIPYVVVTAWAFFSTPLGMITLFCYGVWYVFVKK